MSDREPTILAALETVTEFTSVRLIVLESQDDLQPQPLPFAVFTMGQRDYSEFETLCGADVDIFTQDFDVQVFAKTAEQCRALAIKSITALSALGAVSGIEDSYESELRAFSSVINFSS